MEIVIRESNETRKQGLSHINLAKTESHRQKPERNVTSVYDVIDILESQPSLEEFLRILKWIQRAYLDKTFSLYAQTPLSARILSRFTTTIVADFWENFRSDEMLHQPRKAYLASLQSTLGVSALIKNINALLRHHKVAGGSSKPAPANRDYSILLDTTEVLCEVLAGPDTLKKILDRFFTNESEKEIRRSLWRQAVSLISGSKVLNALSQIDELIRTHGLKSRAIPFSRGDQYSIWLGKGIQYALIEIENQSAEWVAAIADLYRQALSLGYQLQFVENVFSSSLQGNDRASDIARSFFRSLKANEKRRTLSNILELASTREFRETRVDLVSGLAALLAKWCAGDSEIQNIVVELITKANAGAPLASVEVHRAIIAVIATTSEKTLSMCNDILLDFGGKLEIQKQPILQQERKTEDLLLLIGRLFRQEAAAVQQLAKSSSYINAISNRIAASAHRSQYFGMVLATAVSGLVDDQQSRVKFTHLLTDKADLKHFTHLIDIQDNIGSIEDLQHSKTKAEATSLEDFHEKQTLEHSIEQQKLGDEKCSIQSVDNYSESDNEIEPNPPKKKLSTPVYIRELLEGLRDVEDHDRFTLSLSTAATLIRRKATFGNEVREHADELAAVLVGARDALNDPNFANAQLHAMISLIVSQPEKMGRWFSLSAFTGDYSVAQRLAVLSSIALAARELAGHEKHSNPALTTNAALSRSKPLPSGLRAFADPEQQLALPVDQITSNMNKEMIQPMAVSATDRLTGLDSLKVRTLSSRIAAQQKGKRLIRNDLSKHIANEFFFPLVDRFRLEIETRGSVSSFWTPLLLAHYLKTIALLVHAAGPNTMSLPALTSELFELSLSPRLRGAALEHLPVLDALLFCILTTLDVNSHTERDLVNSHGNQVLEIKAWVETLLKQLDSGDHERERIHVLAAGVLVRCSEIIERYQRDIVARMSDLI